MRKKGTYFDSRGFKFPEEKQSPLLRYNRIFNILLCVLAITVILFIAFCGAVMAQVRTHTTTDSLGNTQKYGYTKCEDGRPVISLREDIKGSVYERTVLVHEELHAKEMVAMGCERFLAKYGNDQSFHFNAELRAYCENSKQSAIVENWSVSQMQEELAIFMRKNFKTYPLEEILKRARRCK